MGCSRVEAAIRIIAADKSSDEMQAHATTLHYFQKPIVAVNGYPLAIEHISAELVVTIGVFLSICWPSSYENQAGDPFVNAYQT